MIDIQTPLDKSIIASLSAGDSITLSGNAYTARDAAHARLARMIQTGEDLPHHRARKWYFLCRAMSGHAGARH